MWLLCLCLIVSAVVEKTPEEETQDQLTKVRRIFVDTLTGGDSALMIRDLLISKLQSSKLFILTEDEDKADAVLKGAGDDTVFTNLFQSSNNINGHTQLSTGGSNSNSSNSYGGVSMGENESHRTEERKHEAIAAVRLVNKDGDVIWSTTQESFGGKFHRASTNVADRITKRLIEDFERARK